MSELTGRERTAIEAVTRHFRATWKVWKGSPSGAYLTVDGQRVAAAVVAVTPGRGRPRLRFDRVVTEVAARVQSDLRDLLPRRQSVMVTITAPILQPGKTAVAIVESVQRRLESRPARLEIGEILYRNRVRASLLTGVAQDTPKAMVFVHNPDSEADIPQVLFGLTRSLLEAARALHRRRKRYGHTGYGWLILAPEGGRALIPAYRHILSQLDVRGRLERVLLVLPRGRVQALRLGREPRRLERTGGFAGRHRASDCPYG